MSPMARRVPSPGPSAPLALRLPVRASAPPRKRNKRRRQAPASPRHARTRERGLLSWGPGPLLGRGQASCHPRQAALLLRHRPLEPSKKCHQHLLALQRWPGPAGPGRGLVPQNKGVCVAGGSTKPAARPQLRVPRPASPSARRTGRRDAEEAPKGTLAGDECQSVPWAPCGPRGCRAQSPHAADSYPTGRVLPPPAPRLPRQVTPPGASAWGAG